jgi:phosphoenolpyruvate synthase/pyruvate phosphate dikinase
MTNYYFSRTVEGFSKGTMSASVSSSISDELDRVFGSGNWPEKKFAVRSSAVGEDSTDLSSAGQNETFLGCSGENRIRESVLKCWASLFAFQSVEYRRYFIQMLIFQNQIF